MEKDYYKIGVSRSTYTEVYIAVPKGEKITHADRKLIKTATLETTDNYDWDDYGWENTLEVEEISQVDENEATSYKYYEK